MRVDSSALLVRSTDPVAGRAARRAVETFDRFPVAFKAMRPYRFTCKSCGEVHEGIPALAADAPAAYFAITETERASRAELGSDQCIIDGSRFFVRACLEIPVRGREECFEWGVWVSVSEAAFDRMSELWTTPGRESEPPYSGSLGTNLPYRPETIGLELRLHTRAVGLRPIVELEPSEHPLSLEQRRGIDEQRLVEILENALHPWPPAPCAAVVAAFTDGWGVADDVIVFDHTTRPEHARPPIPKMDVWIWRADEEVDATSFITCGMAARALPGAAAHRLELHMGVRDGLPPDAERRLAAFLANVACYPWDAGQILDFFHTIRTELPIPGFPSCSSILFLPAFAENGIDRVPTDAGEVHVLQLVPITKDEHAIARRNVDELFDHWERAGVDWLADRGG